MKRHGSSASSHPETLGRNELIGLQLKVRIRKKPEDTEENKMAPKPGSTETLGNTGWSKYKEIEV